MEEEIESTTGSNWLDLPIGLTENILQRLGMYEVLTSACRVCAQWWNICNDPLMWRTIRIPYVTMKSFYYLRKIYYKAIERSCRHPEDIDVEYYCTDALLQCIADNHLRCMQLVNCSMITNEGFIKAVTKLPQLQKVNISGCYLTDVSLEILGRSCPLLRSLNFEGILIFYYGFCDESDDMAFAIAETMPGLCHLDFRGYGLTDVGLLAILDKCPLLKSLDIRGCIFLELSESLKIRCIDQINDLQVDSDDEDSFFCDDTNFSDTEYTISDDDNAYGFSP